MHHPLSVDREAATAELSAALAALRGELDLPAGFTPEVAAAADAAVAAHRMPDRDLTDLPLVTLDPPGATDLDQAFAIETQGDGWRVYYAIADLPSFVDPGGPIDAEARRRGQTLYAADGRIPLHPPVISEGAASLLPGVDRAAFVWQVDLDGSGATTSAQVHRARVRSRRQWSYAGAQAALDQEPAFVWQVDLDGSGATTSAQVHRARVRSRRQWSYAGAQAALDQEPAFGMLRAVGEARLALESARGGASLATPEILVLRDARGYRLQRRVMLPVEAWNAQVSLLTGMAAARMMLDGGIGILRTMPPAEPEAIERFRRQTIALGTPWAAPERYGDYLKRLSDDDPRHLAIRHAAASLFRGAAYRAFDGEPPEQTVQAAIGAPYAHVTAPLRRLVDRFGLEVCLALSTGTVVPSWVVEALPELPTLMGRSATLSGRLDRRTLDIVEAAVLAPRVGQEFDAVAISESTVQLEDPAVEAACDGPLEPGAEVRVRLAAADIPTGTVRFEAV